MFLIDQWNTRALVYEPIIKGECEFSKFDRINWKYPRLVKNDIYLETLIDFWKKSLIDLEHFVNTHSKPRFKVQSLAVNNERDVFYELRWKM